MTLRKLAGGYPPRLRAMYEDYIEELVSFGARYQRGVSGTWEPDLLPYWVMPRAETEVLLIEEGAELAGFAFVGHRGFPYMSPERDHTVSEFFIRPAMRGKGIGQRAAVEVLRRTPGKWELGVLPGNTPALRFWRRVLAEVAPFVEVPAENELRFELVVS